MNVGNQSNVVNETDLGGMKVNASSTWVRISPEEFTMHKINANSLLNVEGKEFRGKFTFCTRNADFFARMFLGQVEFCLKCCTNQYFKMSMLQNSICF